MAAAALVPLDRGAGVSGPRRRVGDRRLLVAVAVALAALAGVLSVGGAVWVAPILVLALLAATRSLGARGAAGRAIGAASR